MGAITDGCCHAEKNKDKKLEEFTPLKKASSLNFSHKKLKTYHSTTATSMKSLAESPITNDVQRNQVSSENGSLEDQFEDDQPRKYICLDDFVIKGQIGSGNFGSVYLVVLKSEETNGNPTRYALKKISKEDFSNKKVEESTKLEKMLMISLHHPFLTDLKFAFSDEKSVYLVMNYASGGSIQTFFPIKEQNKRNQRIQMFKKLGEEGIRFIAASVILGLEHLHENQIIYRDLKPENIIIFEDGYVKLTDFGLTKILMNNQQTKTEAGTVLYFAPEIILKQGYSKLADLWQLGIFIYELATSKLPFRKDQILTRSKFKDIILQFEKQNNWKDCEVSDQLKDLVKKLLRFDPKERIGVKGFGQLKHHPFFSGFDWDRLLKKELPSPLLSIINECPSKVKEVKQSAIKSIPSQKSLKFKDEWNFDYRSLN